jgi:excisionase family DNA binding protein
MSEAVDEEAVGTPADVARLAHERGLEISVDTIRRDVREGRLRAIRTFGSRSRPIKLRDAEAYIAKRLSAQQASDAA